MCGIFSLGSESILFVRVAFCLLCQGLQRKDGELFNSEANPHNCLYFLPSLYDNHLKLDKCSCLFDTTHHHLYHRTGIIQIDV